MLILKDIHKYYFLEGQTVKALKGVSVKFRKSEFVSILGPSGCGKTTMLNIIGGLDRYTTGDLIINGKSTKDYKDKDWDSYRNHKIGFVFQSYNLIPHLTVLENVELALTLSGVSKTERKRRAAEVLEKVGLSDKLKSKPNQLSGGQMQRVAIARSLINNPDILLADEPTGALDSKTSGQIMEILKEISKEKLIIMVTHNSEIADRYSTRIIKLLDGELTDDTDPYENEQQKADIKPVTKIKRVREKRQKTSMSFLTALSLSFKNLLTKKTRTLLVSVAGSIGIIGIALILALSSGFQAYIDRVQNDTLSSYPLSIERENIDLDNLLSAMRKRNEVTETEDGKVYSNDMMIQMFETVTAGMSKNNLQDFKTYIDQNRGDIEEYISDIKYAYNLDLQIYKLYGEEEDVLRVNPSNIFQDIFKSMPNILRQFGTMTFDVWNEMLDNRQMLDSQYDIVAGNWPQNFNDVVIVTDKNNQINDFVLYTLGLKDPSELIDLLAAIQTGNDYEYSSVEYTYDELLELSYKLVLPSDYYQFNEGDGTYTDMSEDTAFIKQLIKDEDKSIDINVVGIVRPNEQAAAASIQGTIGYTSALTEYYINTINESDIVLQQIDNPETDIFSARAMEDVMIEQIDGYIDNSNKSDSEKLYLKGLPAETKIEMFSGNIETTYENNLTKLGVVDLQNPYKIRFYPLDFKSKDQIKQFITDYNNNMTEQQKEENIISYTDYVDIMMSSITVIISAITYILIGFVTISLVVSSIMIGIITYISVLERIKEIGILRSIGASKKDISHVFNAETLIVGFAAGMLGILVTLVLTIPLNIILHRLADLPAIAALPPLAGVILVLISMSLTLIAGIIPSKIAARKDPVEALRTE